ncbi:uncharacterized protein RSE6_12818 [Rhynchosporium secalis]|uniref:F-box domain-containing protein n=1 Tax=Rhynchosporium secalis TaxID=38038 RepID=A0A1E1MRF3_RHYSE|nr:uncharacterized protein RSE6_12818 [Rhynchosporium secalis]
MASPILRQGLPNESLWDFLGDMLMPVLQLLSPRELHVLSLVSKVSRATCEPLLYSSIEWTWLEDRPPPITAFIRTILRRPELAAHVRSVSLLGDSFIPYDHDRDTVPPRIDISALDYEHAVKAVESTRVDFALLPMKLLWRDQMHQGAMDTLVTLLLSQLHNIRTLVLGPIFTFETGLLLQLFHAAVFRQAKFELPTYQHLRVLCLNFDGKQGLGIYSLGSTDLQPWFYLPAIQEFSLVSSMPLTWDKIAMHTPTSSLLTTLHLTAVQPEHLGQILSMTPALKNLSYNWYYRSGVHLGRPEEGSVWVNLDAIGLALSHVRDTLEELVVTGRVILEEDYEYEFIKFEGNLSRMANLDHLKILQIPLPFLTGDFHARDAFAEEKMFPPNLKSLRVTDDVLLAWPWKDGWNDNAVSSALQRWYVLHRPAHSLSSISMEIWSIFNLDRPRTCADRVDTQYACDERGGQTLDSRVKKRAISVSVKISGSRSFGRRSAITSPAYEIQVVAQRRL